MNGYGKLRQMTDRNAKIVEFYLYLCSPAPDPQCAANSP